MLFENISFIKFNILIRVSVLFVIGIKTKCIFQELGKPCFLWKGEEVDIVKEGSPLPEISIWRYLISRCVTQGKHVHHESTRIDLSEGAPKLHQMFFTQVFSYIADCNERLYSSCNIILYFPEFCFTDRVLASGRYSILVPYLHLLPLIPLCCIEKLNNILLFTYGMIHANFPSPNTIASLVYVENHILIYVMYYCVTCVFGEYIKL